MTQVCKTINKYTFFSSPKSRHWMSYGIHLSICEYSKLNVRNVTLIKYIERMSYYKIVILFLQILNYGAFLWSTCIK